MMEQLRQDARQRKLCHQIVRIALVSAFRQLERLGQIAEHQLGPGHPAAAIWSRSVEENHTFSKKENAFAGCDSSR